jgi:hypothetical protein
MKILLLAPLVILAGCASLHERQTPLLSVQAEPEPVCRDLLEDYEAYSYMEGEAKEAFYRDIDQQWRLTGDHCEQLRLALIRSQGNAAERARALKAVEELLDSGALTRQLQAQRLALLLYDRLSSERRQLLRSTELQHLLNRQRALNRGRARELEDLRSQLRQLKQIEQNINEKEQSLIPPAANELSPRPVPDPGGG